MVFDRDYIDGVLKGRPVFTIFKKGGRIQQQLIYDSACPHFESLRATSIVLELAEGGEIGPHMIEKELKEYLPWESIEATSPATIRVWDVVQQPNRAIVVTMFDRDYIDGIMTGRPIFVIFKTGGRVKEQRIYVSTDDHLESRRAISVVLDLADGGEIGPHLIGKGFEGRLPWERWDDYSALQLPFEKFLEVTFPVRVADVVRQSNGTTVLSIY